MANGNGGSHDWRNWLIGIIVPVNIALVGVIWNSNNSNTIKLDLDARTMQQDIAVIKEQVSSINERLKRLEARPYFRVEDSR